MTRELKNVLEVIDDLKASSLVNVQILKKSLGEINGKLEEISDAEELIFIRNAIADFKDSLDNKFYNIFEQIRELRNEAENDETAVQNAELFEEKFQSLASAFSSNVNTLTDKIERLENRFYEISGAGVEAAKEEFLKITDELKIFHQEMSFNAQNAHNTGAERVAELAEQIKFVSENINTQIGAYKELLEHKAAQVNELIEANSETIKGDNEFLKAKIKAKFKELEEANAEYINDLDTIKASVTEVLNRTDKIPAETSNALQHNFDSIAITAQDALCEIKNLQDYARDIAQAVSTVIEFAEKNQNSDIINAVKELDFSKELSELFEKVDIINNNFNIKSEFLEDQVLQMKTMFSDISIDIQNKEAELLQKESERVQQYYDKIEFVADSVLKLEESLKLTGLEYKEQISALNSDLNEFVAEFNSIYNEVSNSTQMEINNSLEELKQFMSVNSTNYNDKLVIIQEQFTQAFRDLYEIVNKNNTELTQAGVQAQELNDASIKLLESLDAKIDVIAGLDYSENFEALTEQNDETQELVKILQSKVDKLLTTDFNVLPEKQKIVNTQVLDYLQELNDKITIIGQDKVTESNTLNQLLLLAQPEDVSNADLLNAFEEKIAELTKIALAKKDTEVLELNEKILSLINEIDVKLDVLASVDYEENFDELFDKISETQEMVSESDKNVLTNRRFLEKNQDLLLETKKLINDNSDMLLTNSLSVNENKELIGENQELISQNRKLLYELHAKLDVFVSTSDTSALEDELDEIRDIILEQRQILGQDKNSVISENIDKLLTRIDGISKTIDEHDENSAKIKEDLVNTIVSVFSSSNFVEETEEIKDFVEEKTGELSQQLITVQSQIQTIKQNEIADYSYTLADVESDIAKLRLVLNDISSSTSSGDINQISRNIHNLTSSIESISKNLTPAEIYQLKTNILKLNDDILSISSRTNKLLLNSDEAQKTISEGLLAFSHMAYNLEERMTELSNKEFNAEMADKLERMTAMLENSASMDNTFHKAMMFLGEWVDAASETIESINEKADEISEVSEALAQLRKIVPEKMALVDMLEERFEEQQSRMDRLETKLDELTQMTLQNNVLSVAQKIDKMERIISAMGNSIEKLTTYVD